jgi:hypothetical protein
VRCNAGKGVGASMPIAAEADAAWPRTRAPQPPGTASMRARAMVAAEEDEDDDSTNLVQKFREADAKAKHPQRRFATAPTLERACSSRRLELCACGDPEPPALRRLSAQSKHAIPRAGAQPRLCARPRRNAPDGPSLHGPSPSCARRPPTAAESRPRSSEPTPPRPCWTRAASAPTR